MRQLRDLERHCQLKYRESFINTIDMFAGTSNGGWMSLYFASPQSLVDARAWVDRHRACPEDCNNCDEVAHHKHCDHCVWVPEREDLALAQGRVASCIDFADRAGGMLAIGLTGILRMASGFWAALETGHIEELLRDRINGPGAEVITLGDLPKDVAIVTFDMGAGSKRAKPNVYDNLSRHAAIRDYNHPEASVAAYEVALRTSAFPIFLPMRAGHVDGAMFANNPGMCAIAEVLRAGRDHELEGLNEVVIDDMFMMSLGITEQQLGTDDNQEVYRERSASWGWWRWMLELKAPLLLMETMMVGADSGVSFQCEQLLRERYCRISSPVPGGMVGGFLAVIAGFRKMFRQANVTSAHVWHHDGDGGAGASWDEARDYIDNVWWPAWLAEQKPKKTRRKKR